VNQKNNRTSLGGGKKPLVGVKKRKQKAWFVFNLAISELKNHNLVEEEKN